MSERHGWTMTSSGLFGSSEEFQGLVKMVDAIFKGQEALLRKKLIGPSAELIMSELRDGRCFQFAKMIRCVSSVGTRIRDDEDARERRAMMVGILKVLIFAEGHRVLGGESRIAAYEIVKKLVCEHGLAPCRSFVKRWAIRLGGGYICVIDGELNGGMLLEEAQTFSSERDARTFISRNPAAQHHDAVPVEVEVLEG